MHMVGRGLSAAWIATLMLFQTACAGSAPPDPQVQTPTPDVVARVGDRNITLAELDKQALMADAAMYNGLKMYQALYEARRAALDELVGNILIEAEAKSRSVSAEALVSQEITSHVQPVAEQDVETWYKENPGRVRGAPLDQIRAPIRGFLEETRRQEARQAYIEQLKKKTAVSIALPPPRIEVKVAANDPAQGPANAPVVVVAFSDFQCPFCKRVLPSLQKMQAEYGDRVRLVFRDFPLSIHDEAFVAAEAGQCANDQDKFWPYHDKLFENQEQGLAPDKLKEYARQVGLDGGKFDACLDGGTHRAAVEQDLAEAETYGVTGTPTFFVNGRFLSGAQPFEAFKELIDEELQPKTAAAR